MLKIQIKHLNKRRNSYLDEQIRKQNQFSQVRENQAKLGAYYTDQNHCRWIAGILQFPEEEVCCLEPAIGDASAVLTVTEKRQNTKIHIFGVDLNEQTADIVSRNPEVDECLWGDFLTDVIIKQKAFSFCFSNPPYGEISGKRQELKFLQKLEPYLMEEAILVYVIPYYVMNQKEFQQEWSRCFSLEACYRFHMEEFKKWKQVVLIGRKKTEISQRQLCEKIQIFKDVEEIPLLPSEFDGKKIVVYPSFVRGVTDFTTKDFNYKRAASFIKNSSLSNQIWNFVGQEKYISDRLSRPPILPNSGQMYLMAVSGAGQGLVGSEETKDLHLQRGIVKNVEESEYRENESGETVEVVQKFTRIYFNIIENSGEIHSM